MQKKLALRVAAAGFFAQVVAIAACTTNQVIVPPDTNEEEQNEADDDAAGVTPPPAFKDSGSSPTTDGETPNKDAGTNPKDSGTDSSNANPCGSISTNGTCTSTSTVATCVFLSGQGGAEIITKTCAAHEQCSVVGGVAGCNPLPERCEPGASRCTALNTGEHCNDSGNWVSYPCAECTVTSIGALCPATVPTQLRTGVVQYQARFPNAQWTDWDTVPENIPAQGLLAVSYYYDTATATYVPIDAQTTDNTGSVSLRVPTTPGPNDRVVAWAIRSTPTKILYGVAHPEVGNGQQSVKVPIPSDGATADFWSWYVLSSSLGPTPTTLTITEALGSGAVRVFDYLRYGRAVTESVMGAAGKSLIVWLRNNTTWDCGSCYLALPTTFQGQSFDSQMFFPSSSQDLAYWADPVTTHDLGHWVLSSYGSGTYEGGPHQLSCPTYPGQAWSEGFSTGFSSLVRSNSTYYDKQNGTFFWFDIAQSIYGAGWTWQQPTAAGGLMQLMDENAVSTMMWKLADNPTLDGAITANPQLLLAVKTPRMTTAPFARGYTWHRWSGACTRTNIVDTDISIPMFADYLDALRCNGMSTTKVSNAIGNYPYPVNSPICN